MKTEAKVGVVWFLAKSTGHCWEPLEVRKRRGQEGPPPPPPAAFRGRMALLTP